MGHLVVNSGIRCQVILVKRAQREWGKWRTIGARYTASVVVTISKVLDLVGIPSILRTGDGLPGLAEEMLLVTPQAIANAGWRGAGGVAVQKSAPASKLDLRGVTEFGAGGHWGDQVLPFASVVLLE